MVCSRKDSFMKHNFSDVVRASLYVAKLLFQNTPVFMVLYCCMRIVLAILPAFTVLFSKNVIDGLIALYNTGESGGLWRNILSLFSVTVIQALLNDLIMTIRNFLRDKNEKYLTSVIAEKLSRIELYHLEEQESLNVIHQVMQSQFSVTGAFDTVFAQMLLPIVTFVSTISIVFYYYPLVALLYLLTMIPTTIINQWQNGKMFEFSIDSIPESRRKDYYYEILTSRHYAKELRIYDLEKPMKERFNNAWKTILKERAEIFRKGYRLLNLSTCVSSLGYIGMYVYLFYKTYVGDLSIGGLTAFTNAVFILSNCCTGVIAAILTYKQVYIKAILAVMDFFHWKEEESANNVMPDMDTFSIEFKNVTFRYPNTDAIVLDNLSFRIDAAEKAAIVGINGAGKSTIVKLLLRLYEPDSGEILIDGKNIKTYPLDAYRQKFSACFQDVSHYALTYAENIALSDIERISDADAIIDAAKESGLGDIHTSFPEGLSNPMTRSFSDIGVELSGGQWQKVGIARAFFRNAPFIVLDEPSSALDPKAESQIFNSFAKLCGNKSGILISHRLSSIMLVDKILFLENGRIKESGTHSELMRRNGTYAAMYNLQAEKYRTNA